MPPRTTSAGLRFCLKWTFTISLTAGARCRSFPGSIGHERRMGVGGGGGVRIRTASFGHEPLAVPSVRGRFWSVVKDRGYIADDFGLRRPPQCWILCTEAQQLERRPEEHQHRITTSRIADHGMVNLTKQSSPLRTSAAGENITISPSLNFASIESPTTRTANAWASSISGQRT